MVWATKVWRSGDFPEQERKMTLDGKPPRTPIGCRYFGGSLERPCSGAEGRKLFLGFWEFRVHSCLSIPYFIWVHLIFPTTLHICEGRIMCFMPHFISHRSHYFCIVDVRPILVKQWITQSNKWIATCLQSMFSKLPRDFNWLLGPFSLPWSTSDVVTLQSCHVTHSTALGEVCNLHSHQPFHYLFFWILNTASKPFSHLALEV